MNGHHFSSMGTAGTQATSENASGYQEFFGDRHATEYSPHFTVNERPIMLVGWNMGDAGMIVLQRVRVVDNVVRESADLVLNGGNMCLEADNNVMFVCTPGTYRLRVMGVDPTTVKVQYTTSQMPHQDYVPAMLAAVSSATIKERLDALEEQVNEIASDVEDNTTNIAALQDEVVVSGVYDQGDDQMVLTKAGGDVIEIDMPLISGDADNIIEKGSDSLLWASPHRWLAASLAP